MILNRFYEENIAQASFLVGCNATGEAIVIDPNRNLEQYVEAALTQGLRITAITETHIHADFLSGARELAKRTGATLYVSAEGGKDWQYAFANEASVKPVKHGDSIRMGRVRLDVRHSPGHTPEHLTFLLTDEASAAEPIGAFTGDFIFAGDVGRPDLLERAAGHSGTMEASARQLYRSLQEFAAQPPHLLLWPGHGAGSPCGKKLGGMPVTSLGYERMANWAFFVKTEAEFVRKVLEDQPEPPRYFAEMKRLNQLGAAEDRGHTAPPMVDSPKISELPPEALLLDVRAQARVQHGFIPGSIAVPCGKGFVNWVGSVVRFGTLMYLVAESAEQAAEAAEALSLIGMNFVAGWFAPDVLDVWAETKGPLSAIANTTAAELEGAARAGATVLDVRGGAEFRNGHIPQARNIPLGMLSEGAPALRKDAPLVVQCQGGTRSVIAFTILKRMGFTKLENLSGGFAAYQKAGLPVAKEENKEATLSR